MCSHKIDLRIFERKSAAAVALYPLYADNEPSAEVYGATADRQQASIVFDAANKMVDMCPALLKRSKIMAAAKRVVNYSNSGFYRVRRACDIIHCLLIAVSQMPPLADYSRHSPKPLKIISALAAVGICWYGGRILFNSNEMILMGLAQKIHVLIAAMSFPFVYICVLYVWRKTVGVFKDAGVLKSTTRFEITALIVLFGISIIFVTAVFVRTYVFYGSGNYYDLIYTSDSPGFIRNNVYLALNHGENDLRQPLFALFAAPFAGIPYLIGGLFSASETWQALLVNYVQMSMVLSANLLLVKIMRLTPTQGICFTLFFCCTYMYLLFILMIEQRILAVIWGFIAFCGVSSAVYIINDIRDCEKDRLHPEKQKDPRLPEKYR